MMPAMLIAGGRRILALGFVVLCVSLAGAAGVRAEEPAVAEQPSVAGRIGTKLVRGLANLTTGVGEIPKQIYLVGKREGWVQGAVRGPLEGLGMFIARTVVGAYDVATFPIPLPSGYQPVLLPDYVWQPEPLSQLTVPTEPAAPMITPDGR
jgi:putative exosortase-associated protein (TIGR04073 family)